MKAYIFPGQGAQFVGMAKDLYDHYPDAKTRLEQANSILGFRITDTMFHGTTEDLKATNITQPAIFLHSVVLAELLGNRFQPDMVAGHSLGEFSALVAAKAITFEDGLALVAERAHAMQAACTQLPSTMAAILGLDNETVETICANISKQNPDMVVVPANYNCTGQLVISGTVAGINLACEELKKAGAKRALVLQVGGAFHSPLMLPAQERLAQAIKNTTLKKPICPIYQNVNAKAVSEPEEIKINLINQLTAAVRWIQTVEAMAADGATHFYEVGPGTVLQGLVKKIYKDVAVAQSIEL